MRWFEAIKHIRTVKEGQEPLLGKVLSPTLEFKRAGLEALICFILGERHFEMQSFILHETLGDMLKELSFIFCSLSPPVKFQIQ